MLRVSSSLVRRGQNQPLRGETLARHPVIQRYNLDGAQSTISGNHMTLLLKTTVYLPEADYRKLKILARARKRSTAELLREAIAEYANRHAPPRLPRSLGAGRSGRGDLSKRAEQLLHGMGRQR